MDFGLDIPRDSHDSLLSPAEFDHWFVDLNEDIASLSCFDLVEEYCGVFRLVIVEQLGIAETES